MTNRSSSALKQVNSNLKMPENRKKLNKNHKNLVISKKHRTFAPILRNEKWDE